MNAVTPLTVSCPYCGEVFETAVDSSAGAQRYVEDCQVCCAPIEFRLTVDWEGTPSVAVARDDD